MALSLYYVFVVTVHLAFSIEISSKLDFGKPDEDVYRPAVVNSKLVRDDYQRGGYVIPADYFHVNAGTQNVPDVPIIVGVQDSSDDAVFGRNFDRNSINRNRWRTRNNFNNYVPSYGFYYNTPQWYSHQRHNNPYELTNIYKWNAQ